MLTTQCRSVTHYYYSITTNTLLVLILLLLYYSLLLLYYTEFILSVIVGQYTYFRFHFLEIEKFDAHVINKLPVQEVHFMKNTSLIVSYVSQGYWLGTSYCLRQIILLW